MESNTGSNNNTDNVAYTFGSKGGKIGVRLPGTDPQTDQLKAGLVAEWSNRDAVVIRVASRTGNCFTELAIINGRVVVVCNTGQTTYEIRETNDNAEQFHVVNDGQYHEIQFSRIGELAKLQVDEQPLVLQNWKGYDVANFNQELIVDIGASGLDAKGEFIKPFLGTLQGVTLNGKLLLEMAASNDPRAIRRGDVQQVTEKGPAEGSVPPPYSAAPPAGGPPPGAPGYPPYQQPPYPPQQPGPYPPAGPGPYPPGAYPQGPPPQGYYTGQPQPGQQQQSTLVVTVPTTTIQQSPNADSAFGDLPVQTTCPACHQSVQTAIQYEVGLLAWLIFGILCLFGLWPCSCIPFCVPSCKDVVHSCPKCHAVIGRHKRIS